MKRFAATVSCIFAFSTLILALAGAAPAFAASTITISPAGEGIFLIQGVGIEDASALEINVSYDTATLVNPRIVEGPLVTGAMTAVNPNIPGTVRIVIIRIAPVRGSGVIATLTFARTGASPGRINDLSARLANAKGAPLAALVQINNPPDTPANSSYVPQDQNPSSGSAPGNANTAPIPPGTTAAPVVIIAEQQAKTEEPRDTPKAPQTDESDSQASKQTADSVPGKEPVVVARAFEGAADAKAPNSPEKSRLVREIHMQKSVLDLFRDYKGEKTADALFALFERESLIGCRQEPLVALSDGKSAVKVTFIAAPGNLTASDIAVLGARLISLKRDTDNTNTWVAELLPTAGEYRVSIAVSQGDLKMIYPLTIAPKIDITAGHPGKLTKADYDRYLKKAKMSGSPVQNVGSDRAARDYVNDYIVAANYLAAMKKAAASREAPGNRANH